MFKNNYKKELFITFVLFLATLCLTLFFYRDLLAVLLSEWKSGASDVFSITLYLIVAGFIIYGNLIYHLTRIGLFKRLQKHKTIEDPELNQIFLQNELPKVTFLIPSYKEEVSVIEQTIWSAALQFYPNKRIVLLLDNPPEPSSESEAKLLQSTYELINSINSRFSNMKQIFKSKENLFNQNIKSFNYSKEVSRFKEACNTLNKWFTKNVVNYEITNHVDEFYVNNVYKEWLNKFNNVTSSIDFDSVHKNNQKESIKNAYACVYKLINLDLSYFERKKFVNLSHEPNKAMNINSYLNLIGKKVRIFESDKKHYLETTLDPSVKKEIPDSKYVVTLDADSLLTLNYTIKLVHQMEKPHNSKVAVIQTPYSSYPNAKEPVEVVAGATTDIQYNIHQGFTYYNSTYWVGANAMIRKSALDAIKMYEVQGDKVTVKYIQDRTVIEDTESSIDLVHKGWKLYNYPERLAFSSTPRDFGSLVIQRARWANGGLIIFPKLLRYLLASPFDLVRWAEFIVRSNYLISIAGVNIGTLLLLVYPFGDKIFTWWLPLASIPYYLLYIKDLKLAGYKVSDIIKVYGLNLILIPINIAGVLKSIEQGITGKKIAFKRTPKVGSRTQSQTAFIVALYILLFYTWSAVLFDAYTSRYTHMIYSIVNGSLLIYSISRFIGFKESLKDISAQYLKT